MKKKLLSVVLVVVLCLGMLPPIALAVEEENPGAATPPIEQTTPDEGENVGETVPPDEQITPDEDENLGETVPPDEQITPDEDENLGETVPPDEQTTPDEDENLEETVPPDEDENIDEPVSLPQLTTPTELHWGRYNESTSTYEDVGKGYLSWQVPVDGTCQNRFQITIYRQEDGNSDVQVMSYSTNNGQYAPDYEGPYFTDGYRAFLTDFEAGTYYFTIRSLGDGENYSDSEVSAPSDIWVCTKAETQLPILQSPGWNYPNITWTPVTDESLPWGGINVCYYFSEDADKTQEDIEGGALRQVENWSGTAMQAVLFAGIHNDQGHIDRIISQSGTGYYYFRIRAMSSDTTLCDNGEWSELSPAYDAKAFLESVQGQLSSILYGDGDADAIRNAVQELDTNDLKTAMQADPDVLEAISALEAKTEVNVSVSVDETVAGAISENSIQIVGAALNELSEEAGNNITLNIGAPEKEHVIDELYSSTLAVRFSMGLDGVKDPEDLKVPVRITLPVPSNINRDYLVVLHYTQSGSVEPITPVFSADGKTLSFVLTSFSDFVITQKVQNTPVSPPAPTTTPTTKPSYDSGYASSDSSTAAKKDSVAIASNISNGSLKISTANPSAGSKITIIAVPSSGYIADTVTVIDQEGNSIEVTEVGSNRYTFVVPDTPVEISAVFVVRPAADTPSTSSTVSTGLPYIDIDSSDWYLSAVQYMYRTSIMTGTSATTFAPTQTVDRASFATMLHRLEDTPSTAGSVISFTDVEVGSWYTNAVAWAVEAGIVNGVSNTSFAPAQSITRQDLVVMLYRYAQNKGYNITASGSLASFPDAANVSGYAVDAILWAIGNGIITGKDSGTIDPTGSATRSEVAAILMRFCENIKN